MGYYGVQRRASTSALVLMVMLLSTPGLAQQGGGTEQALPKVTVQKVELQTYRFKTRLPGRVKASTVAEVRPQVSGIIRERLFEEGMVVKAGQELYKIEDDTYAAAVALAKASVTEAKANLDLAVIEAKRAEDLYRSRSGSAATRDNAVTQRSKAEAALQSAEARLTTATIDLDRTTIRAPVAGVIGFSQTTTGALVAAQQVNALTTIRALDPIYVDVTQSATDLLRWSGEEQGNGNAQGGTAQLILPDGSIFAQTGDLKAAEPQVEPTTGMVTLRLSFANPDRRLLPGLYVEVELAQGEAKNTALLPQSAVMRSTSGEPYIFTVVDGKVEQRPVKVIGSEGSNWVVNGGIAAGEAVVTSGFQKFTPGAAVEIITAPANDSPEAKKGN